MCFHSLITNGSFDVYEKDVRPSGTSEDITRDEHHQHHLQYAHLTQDDVKGYIMALDIHHHIINWHKQRQLHNKCLQLQVCRLA